MKTYLSHQKAGVLMTLLLFIVCPFFAIAQTDSSNLTYSGNSAAVDTYRKNNFKINLTSLYLKNYNFTYERMLARKTSFSFSYRTMPKTKIGSLKIVETILDRIDEDGELKNDLNDIIVGNKAFTGEFRFYGGRHSGARGFYLSVYGRYATFDIDYNYQYESSSRTYDIPINTKAKAFGAGLMIGKQWEIAKLLKLDIYILGGHYGSLNGKFKGLANLSSLTAEEKQDLQFDLESKATIGDKHLLNAEVTDQGVTGKIHGPFLGFRGVGVSLGLSF
jgi:hypothetical protein